MTSNVQNNHELLSVYNSENSIKKNRIFAWWNILKWNLLRQSLASEMIVALRMKLIIASWEREYWWQSKCGHRISVQHCGVRHFGIKAAITDATMYRYRLFASGQPARNNCVVRREGQFTIRKEMRSTLREISVQITISIKCVIPYAERVSSSEKLCVYASRKWIIASGILWAISSRETIRQCGDMRLWKRGTIAHEKRAHMKSNYWYKRRRQPKCKNAGLIENVVIEERNSLTGNINIRYLKISVLTIIIIKVMACNLWRREGVCDQSLYVSKPANHQAGFSFSRRKYQKHSASASGEYGEAAYIWIWNI